MSFGRAKRFAYKPSEITVSPADYEIPSSIGKGISIHKCARFNDKKYNKSDKRVCCQRSHCHHSSNSNDSVTCKSKSNSIDSSSTKNSTSSSYKPTNINTISKTKSDVNCSILTCDNTENYIKNLINNFENNPINKSEFLSSEEFIDDDYHSFTSSEELNSLKKVEEYEYNEVLKAFDKMVISEPRMKENDAVQNKLLRKMENIESALEEFKKNFVNLHKNLVCIQDKQKSCEKKNTRAKSVSPQKKQIATIIRKSLDHLHCQYQNKSLLTLQENIRKVLKIVEQMQHANQSASEEMRRICEETKINLTQELLGYNENVKSTVNETEDDNTSACFNYENICKFLSQQLQMTKEEIEILEQDNMNITMKYSDAHDALEAQSSFIEKLHVELATLKEEVLHSSPHSSNQIY